MTLQPILRNLVTDWHDGPEAGYLKLESDREYQYKTAARKNNPEGIDWRVIVAVPVDSGTIATIESELGSGVSHGGIVSVSTSTCPTIDRCEDVTKTQSGEWIGVVNAGDELLAMQPCPSRDQDVQRVAEQLLSDF